MVVKFYMTRCVDTHITPHPRILACGRFPIIARSSVQARVGALLLHRQFRFLGTIEGSLLSLMVDASLLVISPDSYTHTCIFSPLLLRTTECNWARGVVVSHPLSMREALGSMPSESTLIWSIKLMAIITFVFHRFKSGRLL